jgi:RNA polymerase sigma-70 factor (ECF subfamily)
MTESFAEAKGDANELGREGFRSAQRLHYWLVARGSCALTNDDRMIAERLLDGDEQAFRDVFESFFPRLYRYALARVGGNREDARDIVQQTFCKAFEHLESYRGEASLYGWMCKICRNTLIDHVRKQSVHHDRILLVDADDAIQAILEAIRAPESEQPEQELTRTSLLQLIRTTLDYLPAHYGNILEWKYIEERSVNEIAAELAIAPKAAESLLTRARNAFKEAIVGLDESRDLLPDGLTPATKG